MGARVEVVVVICETLAGGHEKIFPDVEEDSDELKLVEYYH